MENITDSQKKLKLDTMNSLSKSVMKQPANLSQIFSQFNNTTDDHKNKDPDNAVKCKYDIEEI